MERFPGTGAAGSLDPITKIAKAILLRAAALRAAERSQSILKSLMRISGLTGTGAAGSLDPITKIAFAILLRAAALRAAERSSYGNS